jgi:phosphoenolpyruvate synthase/pyruvate phosphate dikinase
MRPQTGASLAGAIYRIPFDGAAAEIPTKEIVGSKAHNLMRLAGRGLPVPPAFVLGTGVCRDYLRPPLSLAVFGEGRNPLTSRAAARRGSRPWRPRRPPT